MLVVSGNLNSNNVNCLKKYLDDDDKGDCFLEP